MNLVHLVCVCVCVCVGEGEREGDERSVAIAKSADMKRVVVG